MFRLLISAGKKRRGEGGSSSSHLRPHSRGDAKKAKGSERGEGKEEKKEKNRAGTKGAEGILLCL